MEAMLSLPSNSEIWRWDIPPPPLHFPGGHAPGSTGGGFKTSAPTTGLAPMMNAFACQSAEIRGFPPLARIPPHTSR